MPKHAPLPPVTPYDLPGLPAIATLLDEQVLLLEDNAALLATTGLTTPTDLETRLQCLCLGRFLLILLCAEPIRLRIRTTLAQLEALPPAIVHSHESQSPTLA